jgi:beta-galactosidase
MTERHQDPRRNILLNGIWELEPGERTVPPSSWHYQVPVPALVDSATPIYPHRSSEYHWYRRQFSVDPGERKESALLVLEQAMFGTAVWVNGVYVGGDISCYTSQEFNVTRALRTGKEQELVVRVGDRSTLPPESAVGRDQERTAFIPGIWGDVRLVLCGDPRVTNVHVIPHIHQSEAEVHVTLAALNAVRSHAHVTTRILEKTSGKRVTGNTAIEAELVPGGEISLTFRHALRGMHLWSPEDPFLYILETEVSAGGAATDVVRTTFGMREFVVAGNQFMLNGKRIALRGGNIAFHRFLSDFERGTLPWNAGWIKRLLIDIPKSHNFNFFRNHLGQMYNRWYDIADEHGMLIQNEWQFWTTSGSKEQITREFTRWLSDNWNHPSIVIWDALNESTDRMVETAVIPKMKALDSTRPWEPVDFREDHPYIFSLGPVLHDRKMGFSRSLEDIAATQTPAVVNEFLWWWLDREGHPSLLTDEVVERWLGTDYSTEDLLAHQSYVATELVELFRRLNVAAIQPFVYLSNNAGPTAHWFSGPIAELNPKPILAALKNAFAPFGLSIELWDRHFFAGEQRTFPLYIFNDVPSRRTGKVTYGVCDSRGAWVTSQQVDVAAEASRTSILMMEIHFPARPGDFAVRAELRVHEEAQPVSVSTKPAFVFEPLAGTAGRATKAVLSLDGSAEIKAFLSKHGIRCLTEDDTSMARPRAILVAGNAHSRKNYVNRLSVLSGWVRAGGTLVVIEPEYGVRKEGTLRILEDLPIRVVKRADTDRGGYDSYVFADDLCHPLWRGIAGAHLRMFNGGFGGEMVSQHDLFPGRPAKVLARSGLKLNTPVVIEIPYGEGRVIISRIQVRGRLMGSPEGASLYGRRKDPVAQRYLLNLIGWASGEERR